MSDRNISEKTKIAAVLVQAEMQGRPVNCFLCKQPLTYDQPRILEHIPCRALLKANGEKNPDDLKFLFWVHKTCAGKKTRGCEGTSKKGSVADGDTHRIRKAERIADGGKVDRHPMQKTNRKIATPADPWGKEYRAKRAQQ